MKDIPVFTTDFGVASLILKEIPYRGEAYIRIQDLQPGMIGPMIDECVSFCEMAGAETVYATGSEELEGYPFDVTMIRMTGRPITLLFSAGQLCPCATGFRLVICDRKREMAVKIAYAGTSANRYFVRFRPRDIRCHHRNLVMGQFQKQFND